MLCFSPLWWDPAFSCIMHVLCLWMLLCFTRLHTCQGWSEAGRWGCHAQPHLGTCPFKQQHRGEAGSKCLSDCCDQPDKLKTDLWWYVPLWGRQFSSPLHCLDLPVPRKQLHIVLFFLFFPLFVVFLIFLIIKGVEEGKGKVKVTAKERKIQCFGNQNICTCNLVE